MSLACMLGGIIWIALLPLNQYSRQTYISENALLPGQVHTYFGGSEQNVFRAYKHELLAAWEDETRTTEQKVEHSDQDSRPRGEVADKIQDLFRNAGLKTARQHYAYKSAGRRHAGENVYAVLHAPRGDGTEAIVLVAALRNAGGQKNMNGVALLVTLARYFKRQLPIFCLWRRGLPN